MKILLQQFLYKMRIFARIKFAFLVILILSVSLIILLSGLMTRKIITTNSIKNIRYNLELISVNIKDLSIDVNRCANELILSLNNSVEITKIDNANMDDINTVNMLLKSSNAIYKEIESISFIDLQGNYISSVNTLETAIAGNIVDTRLYEQIESERDKKSWLHIESIDALSQHLKQERLLFLKKVIDIKTGKTVGYILIDINDDALLEESRKNVYEDYIVYYQKSLIASSSIDKNHYSELHSYIDQEIALPAKVVVGSKERLLSYKKIEGTEFSIISLTSMELLAEEVSKMMNALFLIGIAVILFMYFAIGYLSTTITAPITSLTNHISAFKEGNLVKYTGQIYGDEVGILIHKFNEMIDNNNELLNRIDANEKKKREYELALLQSQIKPHFLYNTLDIIIRLIALNKKVLALKATKDIADFYRIALSKGDEIIPLSREIEHIDKYLNIQRVRYPDILDFTIYVEESTINYMVPKFTLQPIVENAIYHGLKTKSSQGTIQIRSKEDKNYLYVVVRDNGIGMSEEKIHKAFIKSSEANMTKPYGLINVDERLKLYFGKECGIKVESCVGKGTTVTIKVKKVVNHV